MSINVICRNDVVVYDHSLACIAVDGGLEYALKHQMNIVLAIGDFDSLDDQILSSYTGELIKLNKQKDDSDLAITLKYLVDYPEEIFVYGALGRRLDHTLANLSQLFYSDRALTYYDHHNKIIGLSEGVHQIQKDNYRYFACLTLTTAIISLNLVVYPLKMYELMPDDVLTISNEIIDDFAEVTVHKGRILLIQSND